MQKNQKKMSHSYENGVTDRQDGHTDSADVRTYGTSGRITGQKRKKLSYSIVNAWDVKG